MLHHQIIFTISAKATSLGRNHKRRKGLTEKTNNEENSGKKKGSYILLISLNVSGLNAPTKRQTGWVDENMCMHARPLTTALCLTCIYFISSG